MKKYRRAQEVFAWQWLGDALIVDEIKKTLEPFNDEDNEFSFAINGDSLCASHKERFGTTGVFLEFGEYLVFDTSNTNAPLLSYSEEWFKENYMEI